MLLPPFSVLRDGEPISTVPLKNSINVGIDFADVRTELGLIPEYEERETAVYVNVSWTEWQSMAVRERAAAVAQRRLHSLIAIHSHDAVERDAERKRRMNSASA